MSLTHDYFYVAKVLGGLRLCAVAEEARSGRMAAPRRTKPLEFGPSPGFADGYHQKDDSSQMAIGPLLG